MDGVFDSGDTNPMHPQVQLDEYANASVPLQRCTGEVFDHAIRIHGDGDVALGGEREQPLELCLTHRLVGQKEIG